MRSSHRLALEAAIISQLCTFVALTITGQIRRVDDMTLLVAGLVGVALAYFWARTRPAAD